MTSRLALSTLFLALLALSLFLKFPGVSDIASSRPNDFPNEIADILKRHAFEVTASAPDYDLTWVTGTSGTCRMRIAPVAPQGWHRALIGQLAGAQHLTYLFEGATFADQPIWRTRASYYWSKLKRYFGSDAVNRPVFAVLASSTCPDDPMPDLAALSVKE